VARVELARMLCDEGKGLTSRRVVDVRLVPFCIGIRDIRPTPLLLVTQHPGFLLELRSGAVAQQHGLSVLP